MDERGGSSGGSTTTRLLRAVEGGGGGGERNNERPKEPWKGEYAKSVLVLGFSNLVADAITMGVGDFVSVITEHDVIKDERRVREWDVMNNLNNEQAVLVRHYEALGMDYNDATMVVNIFTKYKNMLVDQTMVATTKQEMKPLKNGVVTFISFILFGFTPLLSFTILIPYTNNDSVKFNIVACIVCAIALSLLGVAKARICSQNYMFSMAMTLFTGAIAAFVAYFLGWLLKHVTGLEG
ncbi:hypothetical protein TanjilG_25223 [Lupinus angustifolius]|uniref:Vacuolar iron transporter n=1 Tax=Lupinus angustifolius TaxID=3871 RepID=A0A1J7HL18_LUPAN|nr:hypothetical protein TanjilG_25223 [Lupinus angustifolius]